MREILFRGKANDTKEWHMGDLISHTYEKPNIRPIGTLNSYIVIPETVGQYTGLTDKNGQKIFEGDILRCYDRNLDDEFTAVVEFGNPNGAYNWGFQLKPITKANFNTDILLWVEMEEAGVFIEVIGNVHDNPEWCPLKEVKGE